jgi:hypothetical protein
VRARVTLVGLRGMHTEFAILFHSAKETFFALTRIKSQCLSSIQIQEERREEATKEEKSIQLQSEVPFDHYVIAQEFR